MSDREKTNEHLGLHEVLKKGSARDLEAYLRSEASTAQKRSPERVEEEPPAASPVSPPAEIQSSTPATQIASPVEVKSETVTTATVEAEADEAPSATAPLYGPLDQLISRIDREVARRSLEASIAAQSERATRRGSRSRVVVFRLAGSLFSVPADAVVELGSLPEVTAIPGSPSWIAGVTNLRGSLYGVVDLRPLAKGSKRDADSPQMMILRSLDRNLEAMLVVDQILGKTATGGPPVEIAVSELGPMLQKVVVGGIAFGDRQTACLDASALLQACEGGWSSPRARARHDARS